MGFKGARSYMSGPKSVFMFTLFIINLEIPSRNNRYRRPIVRRCVINHREFGGFTHYGASLKIDNNAQGSVISRDKVDLSFLKDLAIDLFDFRKLQMKDDVTFFNITWTLAKSKCYISK